MLPQLIMLLNLRQGITPCPNSSCQFFRREYLRALFEQLPKADTREQIKALLPQYIDRSPVVAR